MSVVIETTIGDITVDLFLDKRPQTCLNFLKLCKIKYYNLCLFHKIEKHFIAQTGDPSGTGRGGESLFCHLYGEQAKYFDAEFKPRLKHEKKGTLSMVNNGNNMNGSQFFLTLADNLTYLDENHSVFGEVVEGFDVLSKLNDAICDNNNRPYQDIRITHTVVLHDPYDDPSGLEVPDKSPEPSKEMLESGYIRADEEIDDTKGKTAEEIEEKLKDSEAKARATILEMVGDIPDADVKPPENVLFVCKLNPVTTSEDLEVIFSRFGPIVSCEVIKDKKSGESLQYAFIEFEKEEDCENAYFKMDNVLIDDRRIHVDFSQSVSKMTWDRNPVKGSRHQNIVLKDKSKQTDGYDLIFDMGPETSHKSKSKTSSDKNRPSKHKNSSSKDERDFRSYSEDRKSKAGKKDYAYEDRSYKTTKSDKYSEKGDRHRDSYKSYENTKYDKYSEKEERCRYNDKKTKYDKYSEKEERYRYNDKNTKYDKYIEKEEKHNYSEKSYKKPKYDKYSEKEERRELKERDYKDPRSRSRSKSPEYVSKKHKSSKKKAHHKSVSPDRKKKSKHRH